MKECQVQIAESSQICPGYTFCELRRIAKEDVQTAKDNCDPKNIIRSRKMIRETRHNSTCEDAFGIGEILSTGYYDVLTECTGEPTIMLKADLDSRENV